MTDIRLILNEAKFENDDGDSFHPIDKINELSMKYEFPLDLKMLLCHASSSNQIIIFRHFVFYSLNKIRSDLEYLKKYNPSFIDVGWQYSGMGHWVVLAWDKNLKKFFFRLDGGSDGWQRESNEKLYYVDLKIDEKYLLDMKDVVQMLLDDKVGMKGTFISPYD